MNSSFLKQLGITPKKFVLLVVLFIVFVITLTSQFSGGDESSNTVAKSSRRRPRGLQKKNAEGQNDEELVIFVGWPQRTIADATQHDPFFRPAQPVVVDLDELTRNDAERQSPLEAASREDAIELMSTEEWELALAPLRIDLILQQDEEWVAIVGPHELRAGDEFEGLFIRDVNRDGVVVLPVEPDVGSTQQ